MTRTVALLVALSLSACAAVAPVSAQTTPAAPTPQQFADPACPKLAEVTAILGCIIGPLGLAKILPKHAI